MAMCTCTYGHTPAVLTVRFVYIHFSYTRGSIIPEPNIVRAATKDIHSLWGKAPPFVKGGGGEGGKTCNKGGEGGKTCKNKQPTYRYKHKTPK